MGTAVFIDDQNVSLRHYGVEFVQQRIRESLLVDKLVLQRAYVFQGNNAVWREELAEHGIELVELEKVVQNGKAKPNQVDMKISIDIPAMVLRRPSIGTVVLVSGDGDFRYLIETLREHGKKVLLVSQKDTTSDRLLPLCDDWIDLSGSPLSKKMLRRLWLERLPADAYKGRDPFLALRDLVADSVAEPMLCRFLREGRLDISVLFAVFGALCQVPQFGALGLRGWKEFVEAALAGSPYCLQQEADRFVLAPAPEGGEDSPAYAPVLLYRELCGVDERYSPERLRAWLKKLSRHSPRQLSELLYYVELLGSNDLIGRDEDGFPVLPDEESYPAQVTDRLRRRLRAVQCNPDADGLAELERLL